MRKLLFLLALLFSLLLIGCQKEITQDTSAPKLSSVLMKSDDSSARVNLNYDNQNRLTGYSFMIGQRIYKISNLLYDNQGRLISYSDTTSDGSRATYSFSYDQNGRIVQKLATYYSNYSGSALPFKKTYAYDVQGRLIADTVFSFWSNEIGEYKSYKYDQNDNIIEKTVFNNLTGSLRPEYTVKMTYDSKVNPFHSIGMIWHYLTSDFFVDAFNVSKNNVVTEDYQNGSIVSYTYQYNSSNLPTKYVSIENIDPIEIIREFSY